MLEISASVNALRKAAEGALKEILTSNDIFQIILCHGYCNLSMMIDIFKQKYAKILHLESLAALLQNDRKLLLNPFSHDDIHTPFYRQELEQTMAGIELLSKIRKKIIVDYEKVRTEEYNLIVENDETCIKAVIRFQEQFVAFEYDGNVYHTILC